MTSVRVVTPSRLHFGLLGWGPDAPRQYGGVGLMVERPGIALTARPAASWGADGPLAGRARLIAERVAEQLRGEGRPVGPLQVHIQQAPPEHVGLGVGTQLSLAVARALVELAGERGPSPERLAGLTGRGRRSGIGLHGFAHGGLIVDGGRRGPEGVPPLLARLEFPSDWPVLLVVLSQSPSLHGPSETQAFTELPPVPATLTDRLCGLVLLGLLPAVAERDFARFSASLEGIQSLVGGCFSPAQGGTFAGPVLTAVASWLRAAGLGGIGQSSWGPTLYAFAPSPAVATNDFLLRLRRQFGLPEGAAFWTRASRCGALLNETRSEPGPLGNDR